MGESGIQIDIFTRDHEDAGDCIQWINPNARVIHLPGGPDEATVGGPLRPPAGIPAGRSRVSRERTSSTTTWFHSHYWLSAWLGQRFARSLGIPHVVTFHTLALIKMQSRAGESEPEEREASGAGGHAGPQTA